MAAVATRSSDRQSTRRGGSSTSRLFEPLPELASGGISLEERLLGVWADVTQSGSAECLVCGAETRITRACERCGSELS